ncbi:MAG: ParB N-terminal domain-containing protein, partial [Vicinamibacterales bacterium]
MKVRLRPIDSITPYEKNPRKNEAAVDAVACSIQEYGFRQPIVVDEQGVIIVGHTRWKAAKKMGLKEVPVHVAEGLSPERAKAYRIADNQTASIADWDKELLGIELGELKALDFDLSLLGFEPDQLQTFMGTEMTAGLVDPDDVPAPPAEAITKPGDLIILGNHRLLCGDSSKADDLDRLLDGARIHLCTTDPPYNVKVEPRSNNAIAAGLSSFAAPKKGARAGGSGGSGGHHQQFDVARHPEKAKGTTKQLRAKDRPLVNDFVSDEAFEGMLMAWFGNISRVLEPGRAFYNWGGNANGANNPPARKANGQY